MKKVLFLSVAVDHVAMTEDELVKLLKSFADAVTEEVAGRDQVRDQGGGDQSYAGHVHGIGSAKFDDAPDVSGLTFPYNYWRDLVEDGFDEPVLFEVDTRNEIIAMMTAVGTDLA